MTWLKEHFGHNWIGKVSKGCEWSNKVCTQNEKNSEGCSNVKQGVVKCHAP